MYTHQYATKMMQRSQNCPPQDMERNCWYKNREAGNAFQPFWGPLFCRSVTTQKKINSATRYENNYLGDDGSILVILNRPQLECFTIYIGSFLL